MKRRDFLKSTAAVYGGGMMSGLGLNRLSAQTPEPEAVPGDRPNILFILVDELRYPSVFPCGIKDAGEFFKAFMPNVHRLWKKGVKFGNYHTAANACTPARGVIISGLYSQQNWLITTIVAPPKPSPILLKQPVLNPAYPTYGRLLQNFGYRTPYRGKWHVSIPLANAGGLKEYGFQYTTYPDPTGANLQGTYGDESQGYHNDAYTAREAVHFLNHVKPGDDPWCLTVGFVNPHDREFFPAGTEFNTVTEAFRSTESNPRHWLQYTDYSNSGPSVPWAEDKLKSPPDYGYPVVPPNWETAAHRKEQKKPSTQRFIKEFATMIWGGISENPATKEFYVREYAQEGLNLGVAEAPFHYWRRGMDSYTQIMQVVDCQIGKVLEALKDLPQSVVDNTVIVFASDHGEYNGAHGLPQGKMCTVYEEAWHIPLIVVDPSGRFTDDIDDIRMGLTSSVDLMPMLVSLGYKGSKAWMKGDLRKIYGQRHDMIAMLKSNAAPGRPYVLHATDEIAPDYYNFNSAPTHILGLRTDEYKFGVSADWLKATADIKVSSGEFEFYDYSTQRGRLELDNTPSDPRVKQTFLALRRDILPNELQQPLPPSLRKQQLESKAAHLAYRAIVENAGSDTWKDDGLRNILGYGGSF